MTPLRLRDPPLPNTLEAVSRRAFKFVSVIVLLLAALTPLFECFDHWDKNPGPSNDTEIHLTAWFVGVGIVLTLAELLRRAPTFVISKLRYFLLVQLWSRLWLEARKRIQPTESPPLVPLRI
jgi:hypothetical protein